MGDPRHPVKAVIVVKGGCVREIILDRSLSGVKFYVADYDNLNPNSECDMMGQPRSLFVEDVYVDTPTTRVIINKKGG